MPPLLRHQRVFRASQGDRNQPRQRLSEASTSLGLSAAALSLLNTTGVLDYTVTAVSGDATLARVRLALEVEPISTIPLPLPAALLVSGVAGLALLRRRRDV